MGSRFEIDLASGSLLSARIATQFSSQQSFAPSRQESMLDSRVGAILADCRSEAEGFLIQKVSILKFTKGKSSIRCSFLERKGDHRRWWIVDSSMLGYGKAEGC